MAMATERIDVVVSENGSRVVRRNLEGIGTGADSSTKAVEGLNRIMGVLAASLAVDRIMRWADAWNSAAGLIRVATDSVSQAVTLQNKLYDVAQRTRSDYKSVVELYSRAARAADDLGASQSQLIQFTEGVGKALAVQHTSSTEASGALLQLGQALGNGVIQAQEYNSLLDNGQVILQTVANGLDRAGGSVGHLTRLVKSGQVTSKEFFDAFLKGSKDLDAEFQKTSVLFSQSFTIIQNSIQKYVGQMDNALGVSAAFGTFAKFVSTNLDTIVKSLASVGIAIAVLYGIPAAIDAITVAVKLLTVAIAENPIGFLALVITTAIAALTLFRDQIKLGTDDVTTLGDVFRALGDRLSGFWDFLVDDATAAFNQIHSVFAAMDEALLGGTKDTTESMASSYEDFYSGVGTGVAGVVKAIARTIDAIAGLLTGLGISIARVFTGLPALFTNIFAQVYNAVVGKIEAIVNATIDGVNRLRKLIGKDLLDHVKFAQKDVDSDALKKYGQNIAAGIDAGFETQGGFMEKWVDGLFADAQKIGKERAAKSVVTGGSEGGGKPATPTGPTAAQIKAAERLAQQLDRLRASVDGVYAANLQLKTAEDLLEKGRQAGMVTLAEKTKIMDRLREQLKDQLDPLGAINRQLDEQTDLLKLNSNERQVATQFRQIEQQLQQAGIKLTAEETKQLKEKLTALQALTQQTQLQDQYQQNSAAGRKAQAGKSVSAMTALMNDPTKNYTQQDAFNQANSQLGGLFDSSKQAIDAQVAAQQEVLDRVNELRAAGIIDEQTASQARMSIWANEQKIKLQQASDLMGNLASLASSSNKKLAALGKAAAITQAIINTYEGATKALAQGGIYGSVMAAAVVAAGLANVAQIRNQQVPGYAFGGQFDVGGIGGTDSQMVAFRATPGERVSISTPAQARGRGEDARPSTQPTYNVINVTDPGMVGQFLSTPEGNEAFVNRIHANASELRSVVGS